MDSTITAPTAPSHSHFHSSTPSTSAGACHQKLSICICTTSSSKVYLTPIIGCANKKCRPRYYHLRCVGLFHRPDNASSWLCPKCAPDGPVPPRMRICEDAPYCTGPMVECAQHELCKTRWFHLPCAGVEFGAEDTEWTCGECEVAIIMRREREEFEEVIEGVAEQQEKEKVVELPQADDGAAGDEEKGDETEQQECIPDHIPGASLSEDDEPPAPAAASPLKRKSDEIDIPPRKKSKHTPTPSQSPISEDTPEYCICGTPADNDMIACDRPSCNAEWFHYVCVGLTAATIPEGKWFCEECELARENAKKNKKKKNKGGNGGKSKRKR
ncbi:unnamed protein product [Alternaria burnsii]|nr:unnamed protein product [Alternaria burnsii]